MATTATGAYSDHLEAVQTARWKRYAPNPYQWFLRHAGLGFTLDVGCGIGRSLGYLRGDGVGVDHNAESVRRCRDRGFSAFLPEQFLRSPFARPGRFDSMLVSHVLEHLTIDEGATLLRTYLPYVRDGGTVLLITPQERGHVSEETHVTFLDGRALTSLCLGAGLGLRRNGSFPLPRPAGRWFKYNESIVAATVPVDRRPSA
jgi:SAM-dependent methyltransferase